MGTENKYFVGVAGDRLTLLRPPRPGEAITKADALMLAAWLVVLAEDEDGQFQQVLEAVQNT